MGMLVSVYRSGLGDCTNGGVSAKAKDLLVVNVEGPFGSGDAPGVTPRVKLIKRRHGNVILAPLDYEDHAYMFGGNYGCSSDSRFHRAVEELSGYEFGFPVAIHDRTE